MGVSAWRFHPSYETSTRKCCIKHRVPRDNELLSRILRGASDANISFSQLRNLLKRLGFAERIRGDHHIFAKAGVVEIINLQPQGNKAKPYQVKQVRGLIIKYRLAGEDNEK
jgi:hypothetical protein